MRSNIRQRRLIDSISARLLSVLIAANWSIWSKPLSTPVLGIIEHEGPSKLTNPLFRKNPSASIQPAGTDAIIP